MVSLSWLMPRLFAAIADCPVHAWEASSAGGGNECCIYSIYSVYTDQVQQCRTCWMPILGIGIRRLTRRSRWINISTCTSICRNITTVAPSVHQYTNTDVHYINIWTHQYIDIITPTLTPASTLIRQYMSTSIDQYFVYNYHERRSGWFGLL